MLNNRLVKEFCGKEMVTGFGECLELRPEYLRRIRQCRWLSPPLHLKRQLWLSLDLYDSPPVSQSCPEVTKSSILGSQFDLTRNSSVLAIS